MLVALPGFHHYMVWYRDIKTFGPWAESCRFPLPTKQNLKWMWLLPLVYQLRQLLLSPHPPEACMQLRQEAAHVWHCSIKVASTEKDQGACLCPS